MNDLFTSGVILIIAERQLLKIMPDARLQSGRCRHVRRQINAPKRIAAFLAHMNEES
ncbi:hypothetical protein KV580_08920 [Pseudomonas chlororaphis]|nr:hypothetical protein [Pseudomonas chlororaphis]